MVYTVLSFGWGLVFLKRKLISFTGPCAELCFGFLMNTVLYHTTALVSLSRTYTASRLSVLLTLLCQWGGWDTAGTETPKRFSMPHDTVLRKKKKKRKKKKWGKRRGREVTAFVFPINHYVQWSSALLEMAVHLPVDGKQQKKKSFFCFVGMCSFFFT